MVRGFGSAAFRAPFPDVAHHVVKSEGIRLFQADGVGCPVAVIVPPAVVAECGHVVARRRESQFPPGRPFPTRLRGAGGPTPSTSPRPSWPNCVAVPIDRVHGIRRARYLLGSPRHRQDACTWVTTRICPGRRACERSHRGRGGLYARPPGWARKSNVHLPAEAKFLVLEHGRPGSRSRAWHFAASFALKGQVL